MVTDGNKTYCGGHLTVDINTESLRCTPETNMAYVHYTSIFLISIFERNRDDKVIRRACEYYESPVQNMLH